MRKALSEALITLARNDSRVLLLTGDHGYALFDDFRSLHPRQFLNVGIAEQNMVGVAAGLAKQGFRPIVYGLSAFVPIRVLEQIKIDIAHDNLPVIFIGDGAGLVYSHLGVSHQSTEDIAALRAIPNVGIFSPADRFELSLVFSRAFEMASPVYIRVGKADLGDVHRQDDILSLSSFLPVLEKGKSREKVAFLATGSMVKVAMDCIQGHFTEASLWSVPWITNVVPDEFVKIAKQSKFIVSLEEHSIYGGLGGTLAELCSEHFPTRIMRIGVSGKFSETCGTHAHLLREHGLDEVSIASAVKKFESDHFR